MNRFPHADPLAVDGVEYPVATILDTVGPLLTEVRRARIAEVVAARTYTVAPVLEGLYDRGNVSAVLRSAESIGYAAVHVIETSRKFKQAKNVTQGAEKWLDIERSASTREGIARIRARGYRILATHFDHAEPIGAWDFDTPTAIVFGNEHAGVSAEMLDAADGRIVIPMAGYTRSFNISVAAALCLYHVQQDRVRRRGAHGDLSEEQRSILTAVHYVRSLTNPGAVLREAAGNGVAR